MAANYTDIEMAFDFASFGQPFEYEAYLNRQTGETYLYSEYGDNEEELPEDINNETKYIALPHKNDLDLGKRLVLDFTYKYLSDEIDKIESTFRKKGAYSKFKYILETTGNLDKWYAFENDAQEKALRDWCELNDIKIKG